MKYSLYALIALGLTLSACNRVKKQAKDTLNQGGEMVGKSATEFVEGVSEGVERALECEIELSEALKAQGISTGTFKIENGAEHGKDNVLVLYMVFDQDIEQTMQATVFTKKGLESGRTTIEVKAVKGETNYITFNFDERMSIETKSRIVIE